MHHVLVLFLDDYVRTRPYCMEGFGMTDSDRQMSKVVGFNYLEVPVCADIHCCSVCKGWIIEAQKEIERLRELRRVENNAGLLTEIERFSKELAKVPDLYDEIEKRGKEIEQLQTLLAETAAQLGDDWTTQVTQKNKEIEQLKQAVELGDNISAENERLRQEIERRDAHIADLLASNSERQQEIEQLRKRIEGDREINGALERVCKANKEEVKLLLEELRIAYQLSQHEQSDRDTLADFRMWASRVYRQFLSQPDGGRSRAS